MKLASIFTAFALAFLVSGSTLAQKTKSKSDTAWMNYFVKAATPFMYFVDKDVATDIAMRGAPEFKKDAYLKKKTSKEGAFIGYEIVNIKKGSVIYGLGLKKGDVLMRVGDVSVQNPQALFALVPEVKKSGMLLLTLKRGSEILTFTYVVS